MNHYSTFTPCAPVRGVQDEVEMMGIVSAVKDALGGMDAQQAMLILLALCLALVALMGAALLVVGRRSRRAEEKMRALSEEAARQLASAE